MSEHHASKSPHLKGKLQDKKTKLDAVQKSLSDATGDLTALRGQVSDLAAHTPSSQNGQVWLQAQQAPTAKEDKRDMSLDVSLAGTLLDETMAVEVASLNNLFARIQSGREKLTSTQDKEDAARKALQVHESELGEARGRLDVLRAHVVKYRQMIVETELEDAQTGTDHKQSAAMGMSSPEKRPASGAAYSSGSFNHAAIAELGSRRATMQASLDAMEQCMRTKSALQADMLSKEAQLEELRQNVSDTSDALSASAASAAGRLTVVEPLILRTSPA